jgi:hypothetical protein
MIYHSTCQSHTHLFLILTLIISMYVRVPVPVRAVQTTVYRMVVMGGGEAEYNRVKATYYATEDNIERKYAMNR